MVLSVALEFFTNLAKEKERWLMSMRAIVVNEKVVASGKVLKSNDVIALLHKLGF